MARITPRPHPTTIQTLQACLRHCPCCGNPMWAAYHNYRTVTTLSGVLRLTLKIRRCITPACPQFQRPYRPEEEGRLALPKHEFGLDVITLIGTWRYAQHRSVPEIHQELGHRRVALAPRTVLNLLERYDELVALSLTDTARLQRITETQGRVILALDGLQPDVGHEVLWVLRDCLSSEVLLARSMLSATQEDLAELLREVKQALGVPIVGVHLRRAILYPLCGEKPLYQRCHTSSVTSTTCTKRPNPSMRPIATPKRNSKSASVACALLNDSWKSALTLQPRSYGDTAVPCAVPSPTMATRPWPPRGSNCTTASPLSPRVWSGSQKGGLAHAARPLTNAPPTGLDRDGCPLA